MQERLPEIRRNRNMWGMVAFITLLAFFLIWTMGYFGTASRPLLQPVSSPGAPVIPGTLQTQP